MATKATAGEVQNNKQQDQDEGDDPKHFHPAWCAGGQSAIGSREGVFAGVAIGVGVEGRVLLCYAW